MALENQIAALTDEVQKLTAITTKLFELRSDAIETVRAEAAPAPKAAGKKTTAAATETPAEPKTETAPATETKTAPAAAATDGISDETLTSTTAAYVAFGGSDDKELHKAEREARMGQVKEILGKLNVGKVKEIPAEKRDAYLKAIAKRQKTIETDGWLTKPAETAAEDDDL